MIRGHFVATPLGTRVFVTMFIHPLSALFMLFWLGMVGYFALTNTSEKTLIPWGMFYFGIVMAVGGFLYEAVKARDMISSAVLQTHN